MNICINGELAIIIDTEDYQYYCGVLDALKVLGGDCCEREYKMIVNSMGSDGLEIMKAIAKEDGNTPTDKEYLTRYGYFD